MPKLSMKWSQFVDPGAPDSLLNHWVIPKVPNQQDFFKRNVRSLLNRDERRKVFVIISDAFRYEAAQELQSIEREISFQGGAEHPIGGIAFVYRFGYGFSVTAP